MNARIPAPVLVRGLSLICTLAALAAGLPQTQAAPARSTPIALSPANLLVSVNPDANTVSVFDVGTPSPVKLAEVGVGRDPSSVAISPDGLTAFVANAADGTVSMVNLATRVQTGSFPVGAEPMALVLSPNGTRLYVANSASGNLMVFNTATAPPTLVATVDLSASGTAPRAIAVTDNGNADDTDETIFVTLFYAQLRPGKTFLQEGQDDEREGRVVAISAATSTVLGTGVLGPMANTGFTSNGQLAPAPGQVPAVPSTNPQAFPTPTAAFPNQLAGVAIHPTDQSKAYVVSTAASPNGPVRFNQNVQGLVSVFNTGTRSEITAAQTDPTLRRTAPLNLNQGVNLATTPAPRLFHSNPTAMAWRPDGSDAWITVQQSDLLLRLTVDGAGIPTISAPLVAGPSTIVRVDLQGGAIPGKAPRGLVINGPGTRAFVLNYVSRSISVVDISNPTAPAILAAVQSTALPAPNTPDATAQLGAEMFFSGRGPNGGLASEAWGSCAACHPNGRSDNVTWMFDTGPRQTIPLDGTFGPTHQKGLQRILNWSAVRDEVHDFELNSRNISGGRGIIDDDRLFLAIGGGDGVSFSETNLIEQFQQFTGAVGTNNDLTGTPLPKLFTNRRDFAIATSPDGHVFIIGGRSGAGQGTLVTGPATVLEFNPRNNTIVNRNELGFTPRHSLGAAAVRTSAGIRIYAVGGYAGTVGTESPVATVEEYNPAGNTWRTVASLPTAVAQFGITVAGGINTAEPLQLIHVVSGNTGSEAAPSVANPNPVQRFQADPAGPGTWSPFNPVGLTLRRNHGVATAIRVVSSRIFVIGGQNAAGTVLDTVEEYQAQAVTVVTSAHTSLPSARARFGIASSLSTQQIYVMGGVDGTGADQTTVFEYSVANNGPTAGAAGAPSGAWVTRANLSAGRHGLQVSTPPPVANFFPVANTGRSVTQDALSEFVRLRLRPAKAPVPATDPNAQAGRTLFGTFGLVQPGFSCATCHGGANWTRSQVDYTEPPSPNTGLGLGNQAVIGAELRRTDAQPNTPGPVAFPQAPGVLVNVGTFTLGSGRVNEVRFNGADISQAVAPLGANGFNAPSLLSVHETGPYFYSGLAQTLDQVLHGSQDGNGGLRQHFVVNPTQRAQVIAFLRSIDDTTAIFPGAAGDTTINCPGNINGIECTGGLTPVTFNVTASNANGPVPVTCVPPSGTGFRVGTSNVVCTAVSNSVSCSFTVTVVDTTPPTMNCNENIFVQATNAAGRVVNYTAGAFDACGLGSFNCAPLSGSIFPIGMTTVTCKATDTVGNSNSCSFTVTVLNCPLTFRAVLSGAQEVPLSINSLATGSGTVVLSADETTITADENWSGLLGPATASHIHAPAGPGTNAPVLFPFAGVPGATAGSIPQQSFAITPLQVAQLKAGLFYLNVHSTVFQGGEIRGQLFLDASCNRCPVASNLTVSVAASGTVGGQLPAFDADGDPLRFLIVQPPQHGVVTVNIQTGAFSYSPFPGFCGPDSFKFNVNDGRCDSEGTVSIDVPCGLRPQKRQLLAALIALRAGVTDDKDQDHLDDAIDHIQDSLADSLWFDDNHLISKKGKKVFEKEEDACEELNDILEDIEDHESQLPVATIQGLIDRLVAIDRQLAVISVDEAEAGGGNPKKIAEDREEIADGDEDAAEGKCDDAIKHYRDAWSHAVKLKAGGHLIVGHSATGFRLHFQALAGKQYTVKISDDAIRWTDFVSITAGPDGAIDFVDTDAVGKPMRFYRVVEADTDP